MDLTFGARLRSQRERQQVALAAIAEETKISVALLDGLERDDVSRWPGGLFRRAYVRMYAQKIGLEPEQVLREFLELYPDRIENSSSVAAIAQVADSGKRPRTRLGFLIAGLPGLRPQAPPAPVSIASEVRPALDASRPVNELTVSSVVEPIADSSRDLRALEQHVVSVAQVCARIACARDDRDLTEALEECAKILEAQGAVLWVWDASRAALCPVLAHGYPDVVLARLPEVARAEDNAIAAAFRSGQQRIVRGGDDSTGALVAPLLTPDGCVGALAFEFATGGEQQEFAQALATIVSAQLSTLFAGTPSAAVDEEWPRQEVSGW